MVVGLCCLLHPQINLNSSFLLYLQAPEKVMKGIFLLLSFLLATVVAANSNGNDNDNSNDNDASCPIPVVLPQHLLEFYINGTWVPPVSTTTAAKSNEQAQTLDVINPSYNEPIATISLGTSRDTNAAVQAAQDALVGWSQTRSLQTRKKYVKKLLKIYKKRHEEMAQLISAEMGAPIEDARGGQVASGSYHIEQFLRALDYFETERLVPGVERPDLASTTIHLEPIGVVALITPWNWPMNQITLKVIPALLVGCTCILKPSELAPLSALLFAEMIDEAGFPPGVFNLINGDGPGVGTDLSSHPNVDMISFTGSTRAGRLISQAAAASNLKKVSLELGGKGANIIFADVENISPLEAIISHGVWNCFDNSGQSCNAPTRMLVERSIYKRAVEIATETANADDMEVRAANEEGDFYGPVASGAQYDRVQSYIQLGIDQGAKLVAGGLGRPAGTNGRGFFVRPTVFVDVTADMTIAQEEIFGPVLSIMPFDTEEEAVAIANGTPYGLTNYVYTDDADRRRRLARSLKSGMIEMNGIGADDGAPFAAMRASGNGREGGVWGLEDFCVIKVVSGVE